MTHEQKPESAALDRVKAYLRSRKEKPVRQMGDGIHEVHTGDEYEASLTVPDLAAVVDMAEQRRKDAEGAEARTCANCGGSGDEPGTYYSDGSPYSCSVCEGSGALYTRPANVAALEARVKELEGEVERLETPEWYISQEEEDGADSIVDLMECHDPWEIVEIDGCRSVEKVWVFTDTEGDTHQFGTKEEARSAIVAIREGGEHGELA